MPAALLGQSNKEAEQQAQDLEYASAFMVLVTKDGHYVFEPDINKPVTIDRRPTPSEIKGALSAILIDIQSQETAIMSAQMTVQAQMQLAQQMRNQHDTQQVLQQLGQR